MLIKPSRSHKAPGMRIDHIYANWRACAYHNQIRLAFWESYGGDLLRCAVRAVSKLRTRYSDSVRS